MFASYIRSFVRTFSVVDFLRFFFLLLLMRWFADERPRAKLDRADEMAHQKKKREEKKRHSREIENKRIWREKKNAHNKMICYAPVAYGIRKIDCFLIIKTTEHIYILILLGPVPLLSVYRSISFLPIACAMQSVDIPKSVLLLSFNWLYFNGTGNGNAIRIHIIGAGKHMKFGPGDLSILSPD